MFKYSLNQTVYFMNSNRIQKVMITSRTYRDYSDHEKAIRRNNSMAGKTEITYAVSGFNDNILEDALFASEADVYAFLNKNVIDKTV